MNEAGAARDLGPFPGETPEVTIQPMTRATRQHEAVLDAARGSRVRPCVLLVLSAGALLLAPLAIDHSYSWTRHTTSESAGQAVEGAWVARAGFVLFGLAVLWLVQSGVLARGRWSRITHSTFAVSMLCVAAFSSRSWQTTVPHDRVEDTLHSVAATTMGFAFAFGVVATALDRRWRAFDLVAVVASVVLPMGMAMAPSRAGLLQRVMFLVAYLWFGREALRP